MAIYGFLPAEIRCKNFDFLLDENFHVQVHVFGFLFWFFLLKISNAIVSIGVVVQRQNKAVNYAKYSIFTRDSSSRAESILVNYLSLAQNGYADVTVDPTTFSDLSIYSSTR